jgi:hypothetical protein
MDHGRAMSKQFDDLRKRKRLAETLISYIAVEDANLPRKEFLRMVADRINDDLNSAKE